VISALTRQTKAMGKPKVSKLGCPDSIALQLRIIRIFSITPHRNPDSRNIERLLNAALDGHAPSLLATQRLRLELGSRDALLPFLRHRRLVHQIVIRSGQGFVFANYLERLLAVNQIEFC
jgi:hypothetical protein